jgi:hypothetical protein
MATIQKFITVLENSDSKGLKYKSRNGTPLSKTS